MKTILASLVTAVLALGLTACGAGNDDEAKASTALSASIMKSQKESDNASQFFTMKKKEADCIGDGLVDKIGTEQLQEYKLLTKDLKAQKDVTAVKMSAKDADSATDVLFDCTDVPGMMQKAVDGTGQIPANMKDCVNKTLNDKNLRSMFTKVFSGKEKEAQQQLIQPMMKCGLGG